MGLRQLKEKQYLGEGYIHQFKNDVTGELVHIPCTQAEYARLGEKDGHRFNPVLPGHTWIMSAGGTIKVDNPDTVLQDGEFCVLPDGRKVVYVADTKEEVREQFVPVDAVDSKGMLDESRLQFKVISDVKTR